MFNVKYLLYVAAVGFAAWSWAHDDWRKGTLVTGSHGILGSLGLGITIGYPGLHIQAA